MSSGAENQATCLRPTHARPATDLPEPGQDELAISESLEQAIAAAISQANGAIGFDRYMEMALYEPGLGYYANGTAKFGTGGDFITAPEIGSLFARAVARQCVQVLQALGGGRVFEFGAGSGRLAAHTLLEMQSLGCLPEQYCILEVSASLRSRQQATLKERVPDLMGRVVWLNALPEEGFQGCIIANEVLDALPVRRFVRTKEGINEEVVEQNGIGLAIAQRPADKALTQAVRNLEERIGQSLELGYRSEVCTVLNGWMQALSACLHSGLVLLVDYGYTDREYYRPERNEGTLTGFYRHRMQNDPLLWPGLCDITANVDFSAAAHAAYDAGMDVSGFTTQAFFLFGNGLEDMLSESDPEELESHLKLVQEAKTLTLPAEMGERFMALALSRNLDIPLPAFAMADWRGRL